MKSKYMLPLILVLSSALANASYTLKDSGFLPRAVVCRDQGGAQIRVSVRTETFRAGGYIYHRQMALLNGAVYPSYFVTIPSQNEALPYADRVGSVRYWSGQNWRKAGYDYDPGTLSARLTIHRGDSFSTPSLTFDHCR